MMSKRYAAVDQTVCVACGVCETACPMGGGQGVSRLLCQGCGREMCRMRKM